MSTEDDLEEVYQMLSRSFSEDERLEMQQIHDFEEEHRLADEEDWEIQEAVARQQVREQMQNRLSGDFEFATSWINSLENQQSKIQDLGRDDLKGAGVGDDTRQLPVADLGTKLERYLIKWRMSEGGENEEPNKLQDNTDTEWVMAASVVKRTASLLQTDAYRLLRLIAYLTGQECELQQADVNWMAPYLEGHLKLVKGDYDDDMYHQSQEGYVEGLGLEHLPTCHADGWMSLDLEPTDGREQAGKPSIQFSMPGFSAARREAVANISIQKPKDEELDDQSPHRKYAREAFELSAQQLERNSELHEYRAPDSSLQGLGTITHVEVATASHSYEQRKQLDSDVIDRVRGIADELAKGKTVLEGGLVEALDVGDKLIKSNASLEGNLVNVLYRLDEETKWRKVAEKQIHVLSRELHQERTIIQKLSDQREAITSHIRANREFRATRDSLKEQLEGARSRLADERRDPELELEDIIEVEMLQAAIDDLESEKERAWLEFVAPLDGIAATEMAKADGCGRTKAVERGAAHDDICLYCDTEYCQGCSGFARNGGS
ncbi:uncharacterized protein BP5553_04444 [Venustampulla echinocandica]|uniref:Uncharacterized protein n=1 Tax=Venustampulla echinocandica TaxID=2656787 RepID=A0A370TNB2_9HELO|nr:uncharacterized protein BP5553_04444 [Venustampulla echinocandica]RDL37011.1 hypothetical protein BP5553_04444 [Venustampulla echinocandica]